jgi:hypothetical protein
MQKWGVVLCLISLVNMAARAEALIYINEILADPPAGLLGDANGDGVASTTDDEFVELYNLGNDPVDISNWYLSDALKSRHTFPEGTISPANHFLVVFGGGNPSLIGVNWQLVSTGTLSLNNTSEVVTLHDSQGQIIDQIVYGADGGRDQSLVRWPEGEGTEVVLHSALEQAKGQLFSPGTLVDGQIPGPASSVVPEPNSLYYGGMSLMLFLSSRRIKFLKLIYENH